MGRSRIGVEEVAFELFLSILSFTSGRVDRCENKTGESYLDSVPSQMLSFIENLHQSLFVGTLLPSPTITITDHHHH